MSLLAAELMAGIHALAIEPAAARRKDPLVGQFRWPSPNRGDMRIA